MIPTSGLLEEAQGNGDCLCLVCSSDFAYTVMSGGFIFFFFFCIFSLPECFVTRLTQPFFPENRSLNSK